MYLENYAALLQKPKYKNLSRISVPGAPFDGIWAVALGLEKAVQKISAGNESGCEDIPGELVPLEHFNYSNTKLGCIIRQSFSEVNFLGVTVSVKHACLHELFLQIYCYFRVK